MPEPKSSPRQLARSRWRKMIRRCTNPKDKDWHSYGGRGIGVCHEWMDFDTYHAAVGEPPAPGLTLDRINVNLGYQPGNVRWATRLVQTLNRRDLPNHNSLKVKCAQGHPYDEENTRWFRNHTRRQCRACSRERASRYGKRKRMERAAA